MNLESELTLSFYKEIADIGSAANIKLVRHIETGVMYIKKHLSVYDADLYNTLKKLKIAGIPEIYHVIESRDELIIIEEYINGRTLQDLLDENGPFDIEAAIRITQKLCTVLHKLHNLDTPIIHRDIKPSNIICSAHGEITLIDFNVSRKYDTSKSRDTVFMGTADYAAPEQYGFGQSDARTDIYALGQLLNVMLTGKLPKEHPYDGNISKIISKCIHLDPNKRYRSVKQLSQALTKESPVNVSTARTITAFIPPGFRSRKPWKMVFAALGYLFVLYFTFTMEFTDVNNNLDLFLYRLYSLFCCLTIIALSTNYMDIRRRLPLGSNKYLIVRILSVILWTAVFIAIGLIAAALLIELI